MIDQDTILNSIRRAVIATDIDGKITYWNEYAGSLYGWSSDEVVGKYIVDVTPSQMSREQAEEIMECLRSGKRWEGMFRVHRKDGTLFTAMVADSPMFNESGELIGIVGISEDATETLKEEQFLNTILRESAVPTAVGVSDGTVVSFNGALEELTGYTQSEVVDLHEWAENLFPDPAVRGAFEKYIHRTRSSGEQERAIFEITCKDGTSRSLEFHSSIFHGGLVIQMVNLLDRKAMASEREATIQLLGMLNAENSLHDLMKLIVDYMHEWSGCDAVGIRLRDGGDYPYIETRGFSQDFVLAESSLCSTDEKGKFSGDTFGNFAQECLCENIIKGRFDPSLPFFTGNGSFWTNSTSDLLKTTTEEERRPWARNRCNGEGYESVALIPLRAGSETLGLMQFNDKRKGRFAPSVIRMLERLGENLALGLAQRLAARALHDRERKIRSILEASTSLITLIDRDGIILDCNEQLPLRFNTTRDKLIGKNVHDILPESVREERQKKFEQVLATGKPQRLEDCRDGLWNETVLNPVFNENEEVSAVTIYAQDITPRKTAERALRESEERFRNLTDLLPEVVVETDDHGNLTYVNQRALELFGYSNEDLDNGLSGFDMLAPEDRERALISFSGRRSGEVPGTVEYKAVKKDGNLFPILFHAASKYKNGKFAGLRAIIVDITERKKKEDELRLNQARLKRAERLGRIGHFEHDVETGSIYWSDFMYELFKRDRALGPPTFDDITKNDDPDDRRLLEQCVRRAIEKGEPYELDVRVYSSDGQTEYHRAAGYPEIKNGKVRKIFGTTQDITATKRPAILLEQTLDATTDGIWYFHLPTNTMTFSPRYYTMLGYEPDEFPSTYKSWVDLMHPDDRAPAIALAEESHRKKIDSYSKEYRQRTKDGEYRWIRSKARVVESAPNGDPVFIIGNHEDITDQKEAEKELQQSLEEAKTSRKEINSLLKASNAVLENHDFPSTARTIFDLCKELVGASAGYVGLLNESGLAIEILFVDSGGGHFDVVPEMPVPTGFLWADASKPLGAICENDLSSSSLRRFFPKEHTKLENVLFAPLIIENKGVGIISLANKEGGFTERDGRNAAAFGELSAIALKNSRDLELLTDSEERFREIFENMSSPVAIYEVINDGEDFVFKNVNPAAARTGNLTPEEHLGKSVQEVYPAVVSMGLFSVFQEVWRTGEPQHYPVTLYEDERVSMWVENYVCKLPSGEIAAVFEDITEKRQSELALRESEAWAKGIINSITDSMFIIDGNMTINWMNQPAIDIFGDQTGERCFEALQCPGNSICPGCPVGETLHDGKIHDHERVIQDRQGNTRNFWSTTGVISLSPAGKVSKVIKVMKDVTERIRSEEERERLQDQLNQAQKMESVGRLAGGVAHDFNNMLSVIIGHTEMALEVTKSEHPVHDDLKEIYQAAGRSADLIRQLLAFARRQAVAPSVLNLNTTIEGMLKMLRRLIGEDISLEWKPGDELWSVKIDPAQVDQVLANLCVNARDAIVNVGFLSIETKNTVLDIEYCAERPGFLPGEYVMIGVRDNGRGMDKDTVDRIFEPFFTSKDQGEGTGLGLATVYGIVKQNGGFISVDSKPGYGTTFKIFFQRHLAQTGEEKGEAPDPDDVGGQETILLVEDEEPILHMTKKMLMRLGYTVLAASSPNDAIEAANNHPGEIDLLITDVIMPQMNGKSLADKLMTFCPDLKKLFMSGYTADVIAHHGVLNEGVHFIEKPFSLHKLSAKVRETLEEE